MKENKHEEDLYDSGGSFYLVLGLLALAVILSINYIADTQIEKINIEYNRELQNYADIHHPLKELSTDLITKQELSGSFLLIAGSIYGSITEEKYISMLYGSNIDNELVYRPMMIPLDRTEFVTINRSESPYIRILVKEIKKEKCFELVCNDLNEITDIQKVRLYLPDGWEILSLGTKNLTR